MTESEKNEFKRELETRFLGLGISEFELAVRKSEKNRTSVADEIEQHRAKFEKDRTANIGAAAFASPKVWDEIRQESERVARAELLKTSAVLSELDELKRKAEEARRLADQKNRELQALWSEYQDIPIKVEWSNEKLNAIANERASLDTAKIEADFRQLYRATLNGAMADPFAQMQLAGLLVTAPLRKEVLTQLATELESQVAELRARHKALARKLNQKSTI